MNGKDNFSTRFGFMMSIPVIIFLTVSFFMSDLVQKQHPTITSQAIANTGRPYMRFDRSNMTFGTRIADDNAVGYLDPSYFSVLITNVVANNTSHEVIVYDVKNNKVCDENDFPKPEEFGEYAFYNATCAINNTFEIGGYWTDSFVNYMRILVTPCKNSSESNITCKSQDEIKKFFKNR